MNLALILVTIQPLSLKSLIVMTNDQTWDAGTSML